MKTDKDIDGYKIVKKLTQEEYEGIARAMQWPEDLEKWDQINRPINGSEIGSPI